MENINNTRTGEFQYAKTVNEKALMVYTFGWMFLALAISGILAVAFRFVPELDSMLWDEMTGKPSMFLYIAIFSPLAISLAMSFGLHKMSLNTLILLFITYATLMGISLSTIFHVYNLSSLTTVFFASSGLFGLMAVIGATTKTDLTKLGTLLGMAVLGLIIAMLINMFIGSSTMDYIISFLGVIIFTGLAAYHTQNIKEISAMSDGSVEYKRMGIISAFNLYVTFINLFLFLLRLFGRRD